MLSRDPLSYIPGLMYMKVSMLASSCSGNAKTAAPWNSCVGFTVEHYISQYN